MSCTVAQNGCPNLSKQAFTPDMLEQQLKSAETSYLNHQRGVSIEDRKVILSSIFDWYQSDFANSEAQLLSYLAQHHPGLRALLDSGASINVSYDYDWGLNAL